METKQKTPVERPVIPGWELTKNEKGVEMATLPAELARHAMRYIEYLESELYASEENRKKDETKQSEPVSADVEKASDKFIAFVKTKYEQRDHNTIYLFDKMLDAIYQSVLNGLIDECFGNQSQQPVSIQWLSDEELRDLADDFGNEEDFSAMEYCQSELRKRVNAIDPEYLELVSDFAAWSHKYPRGRIYSMSKMSMDNELIELENRAKKLTSKTK